MAFGLDDAIAAGLSIVNKFIPDPAERARMELEVFKAKQAGDFKELDASLQLAQGQIDTNKIEAASESLFKSGWRPYIGWICGNGLAYQFLVYPILVSYLPKIVQLDMGTLLTLLGGLLGLGTLRTVEKVKSVN
jgi:hypothetical protein